MKCEYWHIDYGKKHELGKTIPIKDCQSEGAVYFRCNFHDALVCEKCRCRCYSSCPPMTDEEIKEFVKVREERRATK